MTVTLALQRTQQHSWSLGFEQPRSKSKLLIFFPWKFDSFDSTATFEASPRRPEMHRTRSRKDEGALTWPAQRDESMGSYPPTTKTREMSRNVSNGHLGHLRGANLRCRLLPTLHPARSEPSAKPCGDHDISDNIRWSGADLWFLPVATMLSKCAYNNNNGNNKNNYYYCYYY